MIDAAALSAAIRKKKKNLLKPDMDYAGQEALNPTTTDEVEQNLRVGQALEEAGTEGYDHPHVSDEEMGEDENSQDIKVLKRISARIASYFDSL
jgi:hypothetical protein